MSSIGRSLASLAVVAAAIVGCGGGHEGQKGEQSEKAGEKVHDKPAGGRLAVAATIFPLADVVRRVGGEDVDARCLLPPGQSPHSFQATPEHVEMLRQVRLLIRVGLGVDDWAGQIIQAAGREGIRVLAVAKALELPALTAPDGPTSGQAGGHDHDSGDPHIWLDPVVMRRFVYTVADSLAQMDSPHADGYRRRADAYRKELAGLDEEYRRVLGGVKHKHFVTFHPAFTYVARRYGLVQMSLHAADAEDFGAGRLEDVEDFIRRHNVRAIFVEPQFPAERLKALAERCGAKIGRLDPLGSPALKGYDSYLAMMRSNLESLRAGLED